MGSRAGVTLLLPARLIRRCRCHSSLYEGLEFVTLITLLNLEIDPGFGCLLWFGDYSAFENTATVNLNFFSVGWQHQINFCFHFLISKDVSIDWFGASKRNDVLVLTERD